MRYFIAFVTALGLLFLLLFLLFHGVGKPKATTTHKTFLSYASTDAQVKLTIDGPINGDQIHEAVRITVDNSDVTFEQIQGYQNTVTNRQTFANNQTAYENFLLALQHAGFTVGNTPANLKDERGYCPLGDRYILEFNQDGNELERFWTTSCGGNLKTFKGNIDLTLTLFQNQVPGYNNLIQNLSL